MQALLHAMARAFVPSGFAALAMIAVGTDRAAAGDPVAGAAAFVRQCALCHTVAKGEPNRFGPNLFGVVERPAGSAAGFKYSPAFKAVASWTWSPETVASFISAPAQMVPGTPMGVFQGVSDRDRDDIIAYLTTEK
jgi:cytochrome c